MHLHLYVLGSGLVFTKGFFIFIFIFAVVIVIVIVFVVVFVVGGCFDEQGIYSYMRRGEERRGESEIQKKKIFFPTSPPNKKSKQQKHQAEDDADAEAETETESSSGYESEIEERTRMELMGKCGRKSEGRIDRSITHHIHT